MDTAHPLSISGLVLGVFLLTRNIGTTFAFDKPIHSSIVLLACAGVVLLLCSRWLPSDGLRTSEGQFYERVPLSDVGQPHRSREPSPPPRGVQFPSSLRKLRIHLLALMCALCVRVVLTRYVVANIQCSGLTWEPLIPLAFATLDYWTTVRHSRITAYDDPNGSIYDEMLEGVLGRSPYRYVYAGATLGLGALIGLSAAAGPASTFICASTLSNQWLVPVAQRLGTMLDVAILYSLTELIEDRGSRDGRPPSQRFRFASSALLISAAVVLVYGIIFTAFAASTVQRKRIFEIPPFYVWSLIKLVCIVCLTFISGCIAILNVGLTSVAFITAFVSVCTTTTGSAWSSSFAFPPASVGYGLVGTIMLILGFAGYVFFDTSSYNGSPPKRPLFREKIPAFFWLALTALLVLRALLYATSSSTVSYHPIDLLLYDAENAHEAYVSQASTSKTLAEAAQTYRRRYDRHPPPGFQHWHKYATDRESLMIDDFDSIHRDLLPFWSLSPQDIRDRTWQMMANPWHDASGLSIRNGKVEISPSKFMMPTHAWMLEGLVKMISTFSEWLPDMDLAFNVNDECRVAVPFEVMQGMKRIGKGDAISKDPVENAFGADRAKSWAPLPDEPIAERVMREMSWQRIFNEFGNAACPSNSPAKTERYVNRGELCTACTAPQSLGAFAANMTLANDVCHQPDIANLHGIYVAPAAFKATHDLYPIFSQSKVSGFHDILYPSAWNYIDKARYDPNDEFPDPPFAEKNATLFWRGATSEGFSSGDGQWKGMMRQRFVALANGLGSTTHAAVLLPHSTAAGAQKYRYHNLPISSLLPSLPTDVRIASSIARCGGADCGQQAAEFAPLVPPTDFQAHWRYKYLLDLDGAGFSGRFLPFLLSNSLPIKASVFREWWNDRVTPWKHYVPLDVRGQGLWATLAYFAGLEAKGVVLEGHEREAQRMAVEGREWAERVLRKEDMEVYMFRLLLEWGRLTDDGREGIGFAEDLK